MKSPVFPTSRPGFRPFKRVTTLVAAFAVVAVLATALAWARPDLAQKVFRGPLSSVGKIFTSRNERILSPRALPQKEPNAATAIKTSAQSGPWSTGSTWVGGVAPAATDTVIIANTHTVTLTAAASVTTGTVTVQNGGVLDLSSFALTAATLTIDNGGEVRQGGSGTAPSGTITTRSYASNSTYTFNGAQAGLSGTHPTYGNLNFAPTPAGAGSVAVNLTVAGNMTINLGAAQEIRFATGTTARTHSISGDLNIQNGIIVGSNGSSAAGGATVTIGGKLNITGGTFRGTNDVGDATFNIAGNVINGGTWQQDDGSSTGLFNINLNGASSQDVSGANAISFENLTLNNSSGATLSRAIDVTNSLTLTNGALSLGANTLTLNGGLATTSGSLTGGGSSNITVGGTGSGIAVPAVSGGLNNLTITRPNGITLTGAVTVSGSAQTSGALNGANNLTANGTLQINTGGFLSGSPTYGASSLLKYNTGGFYGRAGEWLPNATSGAGYPNNVQLSNNTNLDLPNGSAGVIFQMAGNLTIDSGSTFNLNGSPAMSMQSVVVGSVINSGSLVLSTNSGGGLAVKGNFDNSTGSITPNAATLSFTGAGAQTWTTGGTGAGKSYGAVQISSTNTVTLAGDLIATTFSIPSGTFDQGATFNVTLGPLSISSGGTYFNPGDGDMTLTGAVNNAGSISLNGGGAGCGQTDTIVIRSSSVGTQRAWSGTGTFSLTDVDVKDQTGTAIIGVRSGTNAGNNGANWLFVSQCSGYAWSGAISTDWTNPLNWSPARTAAASDILFFSAGTPAPIVTNVAGATGGNTETIAEIHVAPGVTPSFSTGGANTLLINPGAGNTGFDVSNLAITGANALTIKLASGTLGSVTGTMSFAGGGHRLIGQSAGSISFGGLSIFSTQSGFTGNAFGDGSSAANGAPDSVRFKCDISLNCSFYIHNAGGSPFGASGNPSVVTFESGTNARFMTASGFDANGRSYSNLAISDGSVAVNTSDTGSGNFHFDNLEVNSTGSADSSLTYTGTGSAAITIGGAGIVSSGVGTGSSLSNINLTAPGGFTLSRAGTMQFATTDTARAINLDGNVMVTNGTTVDLQRVMLLGLSNPNSKTVTVNYSGALNGSSTGYVVGSLRKEFGGGSSIVAQSFPVGTAGGYSPIDVTNATGTGNLTVSATGTALTGMSGANKLSRYWSLASAGVTQADLKFTYPAGDVVGTEANYKIFRKTAGNVFSQFNPTTLDTGNHFATLTGVTGFSDWTLAEASALTAGILQFTAATTIDTELNSGTHTVQINVSRTAGSDGDVSVHYATSDGTATVADNDYDATSGDLNWAAGDTTSKMFTVTIHGDTNFEANELINLTLSLPTGGAVLGAQNTATIQINNDEACTPPSLVYVDDDWASATIGSDPDGAGPAMIFGCDSFATIQGGVSGVASGGTVQVAAGTYTENVTIAQPLTLTGAGAASVFVRPATSNPNCGGAGGGSLCAGGSNIILVQASNVTISGMTLDGDNPGLTSGEIFGGADIDARNGIITNHPMGVYNNLEVHHTTVKNIWLRGIYASSGGTFNFHENTVDNVQANFASIGMFNFLGAGAYTNNVVSNCNDAISSNHSRGTTYTGNIVTTSASGIHSDNAGDSGGTFDTISGNSVTNSGYGIWVFVPYKTVRVQNNTLTNNDVGHAVFGDSGVTTATKPASDGDSHTPGRAVPRSVNVSEPGSAVQSRVNKAQQTPNAPESVAFAASFTGNTINGQNKALSTGVYFSTNQLGFGSGNPKVEFKSNTVINNVDGFYLEADTSFTLEVAASFNRIVNNTGTQVTQATGGAVNGTVIGGMENNWWGCNAGPNNAGCGTVVGAGVDFNPWIVLSTSASPNPIGPGGTSTVTADMTHNSAAAVPSLVDFVPQVGVSFTATQGTIMPPSGTITNGQANSTFTSTSLSSGTGCSAVDNSGAICTNITVTLPSFSIDDVSHNEGNGPGTTSYTFTITKTGSTTFSSSVDYATLDGTAVSTGGTPDFTAIPTTNVTFLPTDTTKQFTVLVNGDTTVEPDEAFTAVLSNASGATISDASGTGTITNDDTCTPPSIVYVDDDWVGVTPGTDPDGIGPAMNFGCDSFATIQGGVTGVVSGGIVNVAAGNYPEQVVISKSLTLTGAGAATTNITTPGTLTPGLGGNLILVQVDNAAVVEMSNITVKGPRVFNACSSAIFYGVYAAGGANLNLHDAAVTDIRLANPALYGCQDGIAVRAGSQALGQAATLMLNHVTITGYQKGAVVIDGTGTTGTVQNSTITGFGPENVAQNAIQIGRNAGGTVTGNTITGNECTNPACGPDPFTQSFGTGFLIFSTNGTIQISNNTISNNDTGVYNNAPNTTISGNTMVGNRYNGIFVDEGTATITDNTLSGPMNNGVAVVSYTAADGTTGNSVAIMTHNTVTGAANGVALLDADTGDAFEPLLTAHFNRIVSTTNAVARPALAGQPSPELAMRNAIRQDSAKIEGRLVAATAINHRNSPSASTNNLENNWWGCNAGPGNPGCGNVTGTSTVDFDPWFVLSGSATPNSIIPGGTSTVAADMTKNSAGATPAGTLPDLPISYSATNGTMNPTSGTVTLGAASSMFTSTNSNSAVATLTVDNQPVNVPITVNAPTFSIDDVTLNEGNLNTTSFTFTITKTGSTALNASVDYNTVDGTAVSTGGMPDFTAISTTNVVFLPAETTKQVTVFVNGDTAIEPTETFTVHLSNASGATITDADGTGTITNDDACGSYATVYVDDGWLGTTVGTDPDAGGPATSFGCDSFATIQAAEDAVQSGGTINVYDGTYNEDITINNPGITVVGFGPGTKSIVGPIGGGGSTIAIAANNVSVAGFTITRAGNNTTDWNGALNTAGISIQGAFSNIQIHDNILTGNRSGLDINNSSGHIIRNNVIDFNRTGMIFRNTTDNMTVVENFITNNWTVGVLFLDGSGATNSPVQSAANSIFSNNDISANWYGQIVDRQTGGSLPPPGGSPKNFRGNWLGTTSPVVTTNNSTEPGYAAQIPVAYGGTATPPGGQPDIAGPASANIKYIPFLQSGTDTNIETVPGRGTFGFQGVANGNIVVRPSNLQGFVQQHATCGAAGTGSQNFVIGPATPPLQFGSLQYLIGANGDSFETIRTADFNNTRIDALSNLRYSTYVTQFGSGGQAPYLLLNIDFNGDSTLDDQIFFEPVYQSAAFFPSNPQGPLALATWQQWDALHGGWWSVNNIAGAGPGANVKSLTQYLAAQPNARILSSGTTGGFRIATGCGAPAWDNFDGNADDLFVGVSGANTRYDFEPLPRISISDVTQNEGDASTTSFTFNVTLSFPSDQTITVDYQTADDTATSPTDFSALTTATLTFNPGDTTMPVTVLVNGDTTFEPTERFFVNLSNVNANGIILDNQGVGTITNDDGQPSFSIDDVTHLEGNPPGTTSFVFTVTKTGSTALGSSVNFNTVDGSATVANNDYTMTNGTLNFGPTDTTMQVTVLVNKDLAVEPDEAFTVHLDTPVNATISDADGTGTIQNDDFCGPQSIVYVDDNWVGTTPGTDPDAGGPATNFGCDSFATIQGGVNGVTAAGTVIVNPGTYAEAILINKALTLRGAKFGQDANTRFAAFVSGPNGPKADPTIESIITAAATAPTSGANDTVHVMSSNVIIDGFVVDGNNPALAQGGATVIGGVNTDSRRAIQTEDAAGNPFAASNVTVRYNVVQNYAQRGVELINGTASNTAPATTGNVITQNLVRNFGLDGIVLAFNAHADITFNTVVTNDYPTEAGIWVQDFLNVGPSYTININNNTVTVGQDNFGGIWTNLAYLPDLNINNNTVNAAAAVVSGSDFTYGIYVTSLRPGSDASLSGNIVGSSGGQFDRGIALWNLGTGQTTTVTGGTVGKSSKGVSLHDNDPNFGLAGSNSAVNLSAVSIDGTGVAADIGIFVDATGSTGDTVAMEISGNTSIINTTTAISVAGTNASANIHDNVASIHDNTTGVSVSGGAATITHNTLYANATGLSFSSGATATAHFNRIISTTTAIDNPGSLTLNLENNWWGCNAGPGNAGCGAVTGSGADFDPWIVLGVSASPGSVSPGGSSTVTADMTKNSAGATPAGTVPDMPVAWSATNGTMFPTSGTITSGQAMSTFTSTNSSSGSACAMVDNENVCTPITVVLPSFSINDVTMNEGNAGPTSFTFTITKTGAGAASVDYNTVDGTATSPSDFTAISATTVSFLSADTTKQITVFVNGDTDFEGNETFTVHLSNPVGATISDADGTGTITNDDTCAAFSTVYVDDSWVGTPIGSDPDGGGPATVFGCDSFATIQGGVTAVTAGGTVIVRDGTYTENVNITKAMSLRGHQFGVDARGRVAAESIVIPAAPGTATFTVAFNGLIAIDGFSFSGGTSGTQGCIFNSVGPNDGMQIRNNRFSGYSTAAIWLNRSGADITIDKNVLDGSNLDSGGTNQAIFLNTQAFNGLNVTNNDIINNNHRYGLFVDGNNNVGESATRAALISGNLFNNNLQGLNLGQRAFGKLGTPLLGTYAGTISNNTFSNNTANGIQAGIQHVLVTGNTFSSNAIDGLALTSFGNTGADRGAQNSLITGNTFTGNGRAGIFFSGTQGVGLIGTNHANLNRIFGNAVGVQYGSTVNAGNNATIDVENNWWGCNFGPGTGGAGCSATPNGTLVFAGNTGVLDSDPWIVLGTSASPNPIPPGGNSTVTADMRINSAAMNTSGSGFVPQVGVNFTAINGTMAPTSGTITSGQAMSTFTSTSSSSGSACSMVDNQNICTNITVTAPSFSIDDVTHMEGDAGTTTYTFTVTKTGSTSLPSSVMFTTQDGSATLADNDYQLNSGTLNFTATDTTQQITVLVNGDTTNEPDEAFNVHLSGAVGATISDADGTGTIQNDDSRSISGRVTYQSGSLGVRTVTMTLTGNNGFVTRTTMTDTNGDYSFTDVPLGNNYTLTPSKTGDVGNLHIESIDASNVARYVAGLDVPTAIQQIAGDADGDSVLTSLDASYIARYVAGLPDTAIVGTWKFQPPSTSYPNLSSNQMNQNFAAILVGDTDGNWMPTVAPPAGDGHRAMRPSSPQVTVNVSLPHVPGAMGSVISVPMTVGDVTGQAVRAYDLQVTFNAAIVKPCVANECGGGPTEKPFDKNSTLSQDMTVTANTNNTGHLILSAFQTDDMIGSGTLINLRFHVVGAPGQNTPLTFEDYTDPNPTFHPGFRFNAGNPQAATSNGSVTVNGPTAGASRLSGQVTNEAGEPVGGVTITVLGGPKTIRVITNREGYYTVEGLETNGFYTVTPSRANRVFAPQQRSFSLIADRTDAVFTASGIGSDDANPLESPEFFVRQQYLDFLNREPEQAGLDFWSGKLRSCGNNDECLRQRRLDVSAAFFISQEFEDSGLYLYDLYSGALGRRPDYAEYAADRRLVVGGPRLEADKAAFAASFVERAEFTTQYPLTMSGDVYVDALLRRAGETAGLDLNAERARLLQLYQTGATVTESRSLVLRTVVEAEAFKQTQYNAGFVLSEYFSYLGRNPDRDGYEFWLNVLNAGDRNNYRGMVCSFVTSAEYQRRFASVIPRSNVECRQSIAAKRSSRKPRQEAVPIATAGE